MKLSVKTVAIAGLSLFLAGQIPVFAQNATPPVTPAPPTLPPSPAPVLANFVTGAVTAVDTNANTITIHDRRTDADVVVTVTGDTKFTKTTDVGVAGLAVGSTVSVFSRTDMVAGATTVDGARITILQELPKTPATPNPRIVAGKVTTTTPSLTITTADGTVLTVNTTPDTQVWSTVPAALTDIAVGQRVTVQGKNDGTTFTARMVRVQPPRMMRPRTPPTN